MRIHDSLNYLLGQYIGLAINSPKKYPKKPFLSKYDSVMHPITDEVLGEVATKLGAKVNGNYS